jgi:carboxymethylenebutenolidase
LSLTLLLPLAACGGTAGDSGDDYADRMATEHAGDEPVASPAAEAEPATPVSEAEVVYATVDGQEIHGFLARPEGDEPVPGILVIHEWWGLNDNIRSMARQLAGQGYAALAVDLYNNQVAETPEQARALMQASMDQDAQLEDNVRQAHAYLADELGAPRVGVIGWCFGGGWSLRTALLLGDGIDAAVIYYGRLVTDPAELEALSAPLLGLFGADDQGIPVESVRAFEAALEGLGKPAEIHVYEGANHAFANPSGTRYNAAAAADAWTKTLAFFDQYLTP